MRLLRRRTSLIATLALVALLGATLARLGHVHDAVADAGQYAHCKLCLHLERAGGPPSTRLVPARLPLHASVRMPPESALRVSEAPTGSHRSRAPPHANHPLS